MPDDKTASMLQSLHDASNWDLWGELRRRNVAVDEVMRNLNVQPKTVTRVVPAKRSIRHVALLWLAILTFVVIATVVALALTGKPIPDVLSGLAGTGLGAIAGILVGGNLDDKGNEDATSSS